jgi:hypothetical protein
VPHLHPVHVESILAELDREGLLDDPRVRALPSASASASASTRLEKLASALQNPKSAADATFAVKSLRRHGISLDLAVDVAALGHAMREAGVGLHERFAIKSALGRCGAI